MEFILLLLLNFTNLINVYEAHRRKSTSILFWGSLFVFFNIPHTIDVIFQLSEYKIATLNVASLFATLFNFSFFLLNKIKWLKIIKNPEFIANSYKVTKLNFSLLVVSFISIMVWSLGFYKSSGNIMNSTWTDMRNVQVSYMLVGHYLFIASSSCTFAFLIARKKMLALISIIIAVYAIFLIKARINIAPIAAPFLLYYLFNKKLTLKMITKTIIISVIFIFSVFFLQQVRYIGSINDISLDNIGDISKSTLQALKSGQGELGLRKGFYYFIQNDNKFNNFGQGNTYKRILLIFFPNRLLPIKPRDFAYDMWDALFPSLTGIGGSYHPIFYGDAFANFGMLGFLVSLFWVLTFNVIEHFIQTREPAYKVALISPLSVSYILLARGAVYNSLITFLGAVLIITIVRFMCRLRIT